jgi:hypothetical protein
VNKEIKKLWLEALRSGAYKQTSNRLRDGDSFCCLGVLCDVHKNKTGRGDWDDGTYRANESYSCQSLPTAVWIWAKLPDWNPEIKTFNETLAQLNDAGADFDLIAAIIETEL